MRAINLPTDLLRAFVSVIDLGGYTRAADALGRTQPAISLQMKRLEELLDAKLIAHEGRELKLTEEGEALAVYARQLLRLNDEAVAQAQGPRRQGPAARRPAHRFLRGLPAGRRSSTSPANRPRSRCRSPATCPASSSTCCMPTSSTSSLRCWRATRTPISCAAGTSARSGPWPRMSPCNKSAAVPLVTHPEGCEYRRRMTAALRAEGRDWRVAYTTPDIGGLQTRRQRRHGRHRAHPQDAAAGHADTAPRGTVFRPWSRSASGCSTSTSASPAPASMLVDSLIARMDEAAEPAPRQSSRRSISGRHACISSINFPNARMRTSVLSRTLLDHGDKT